MDGNSQSNPSIASRFGLAWTCFWRILGHAEFARQITGAALIGVHRWIGELGLQFSRSLAELIDVG